MIQMSCVFIFYVYTTTYSKQLGVLPSCCSRAGRVLGLDSTHLHSFFATPYSISFCVKSVRLHQDSLVAYRHGMSWNDTESMRTSLLRFSTHRVSLLVPIYFERIEATNS